MLAAAIRAGMPRASITILPLRGRFVRDYKTPIEIEESVRRELPFDFLFLLEHAHGNPPFLDRAFARRVVYVPNVEWIGPLDLQIIASGSIDVVLLKTRYSGVVFSSLEGSDRIRNGQLFIGWTSPDVGLPADGERFWDQCLHVCGTAKQRNTDAIVSTWMHRPDLPDMTIVAATEMGFDASMPLRAADNLRFLIQALSDENLRLLQRGSGIHVCPSITEGFGHALNEARAAAAILITTHAAPMDEMVEDGSSGILIPVRQENKVRFQLAPGFRVTPEDLEQSVRRALALTPEQRRQMGLRARKLYEDGRAQFHGNIRRFLEGS